MNDSFGVRYDIVVITHEATTTIAFMLPEFVVSTEIVFDG
jgi:hypothetical protein